MKIILQIHYYTINCAISLAVNVFMKYVVASFNGLERITLTDILPYYCTASEISVYHKLYFFWLL